MNKYPARERIINHEKWYKCQICSRFVANEKEQGWQQTLRDHVMKKHRNECEAVRLVSGDKDYDGLIDKFYCTVFVIGPVKCSDGAFRKGVSEELRLPIEGYTYNAQIVTGLEEQGDYFYAGTGRYCRSYEECEEYIAKVMGDWGVDI